MHAPVRPRRGTFPRRVEQRLAKYFYLDPSCIVEPGVTPDDFRRAMFGMYVGGTIKITWSRRQLEADDLLLEHVNLSGADIVEMGASDGSTSVDLIRRLPGDVATYTVSDLHLILTWVSVGRRRFLFDASDTCILVSGPYVLAWPHLSRQVARLYARAIRHARSRPRGEVMLINPDLRAILEEDPRVGVREHDVFTRWSGPPVDVVKTANVLRRLYFSDADLMRALVAIRDSIVDGGHLLLADHSRNPGEPPAGGLYQRSGDTFETIATTRRAPEIDDLVRRVGRETRLAELSTDTTTPEDPTP